VGGRVAVPRRDYCRRYVIWVLWYTKIIDNNNSRGRRLTLVVSEPPAAYFPTNETAALNLELRIFYTMTSFFPRVHFYICDCRLKTNNFILFDIIALDLGISITIIEIILRISRFYHIRKYELYYTLGSNSTNNM